MLRITSRDNQKLKLVRKIRDGKSQDLIFIEGVRLAEEALKSALNLSEVYISERFSVDERILPEILRKQTIPVYIVSDKIFQTISDTKTSQGVVLISARPDNGQQKIESALRLPNGHNTVLFLHEINNPSNLGAIMRTAEAAGVKGIITSRLSANVFSAKALRGSMGSAFRLPVWENAEFDIVLEWAKAAGLKTICADITAAKTYSEVNWDANHLLIFGSEAHGLSNSELEQIGERIYIPMDNGVESLNLAVACGIILFEAKKERSKQA